MGRRLYDNNNSNFFKIAANNLTIIIKATLYFQKKNKIKIKATLTIKNHQLKNKLVYQK